MVTYLTDKLASGLTNGIYALYLHIHNFFTQRFLLFIVTNGIIISSIEMPPCWKVSL